MDKQFTASEVRVWERAYKGTGAAKVFGAFADLLEAQEKAVPVAWRIRVGSSNVWGYCESEHDADFLGKQSGLRYEKQPLYTHPAPADAERLAEALQEILDYRGGAANALEDEYVIDRAHQALAAHSAQAQPPAASVPGVSAQAHENAQAALAAQENPNG